MAIRVGKMKIDDSDAICTDFFRLKVQMQINGEDPERGVWREKAQQLRSECYFLVQDVSKLGTALRSPTSDVLAFSRHKMFWSIQSLKKGERKNLYDEIQDIWKKARAIADKTLEIELKTSGASKHYAPILDILQRLEICSKWNRELDLELQDEKAEARLKARRDKHNQEFESLKREIQETEKNYFPSGKKFDVSSDILAEALRDLVEIFNNQLSHDFEKVQVTESEAAFFPKKKMQEAKGTEEAGVGHEDKVSGRKFKATKMKKLISRYDK